MDIKAVSGVSSITNMESNKAKSADNSFEKHLENAVGKNDEQQLKKVCKEFEGIMLDMMFKQMKASIPKSDLIPSDSGKDVFESMLDEKLMEEVSEGSGIGLADVLYKQLSKQVNTANKQPAETDEPADDSSR